MKSLPRYKSYDYPFGLIFLTLAGAIACWAYAVYPAQASRNFDLRLGGLGEIHVNHDPWGNRTFEITDRAGDIITGNRSIFGPRHEEVHVLGNDIDVHGGLLGNKSYSVNTMVGDKFQGQRNVEGIGPHNNQIDLQGSSRAMQHVFGDGKAPVQGSPLQKSPMQPEAGDRPASEKINEPASRTSTEGENGWPPPEKTLP